MVFLNKKLFPKENKVKDLISTMKTIRITQRKFHQYPESAPTESARFRSISRTSFLVLIDLKENRSLDTIHNKY